MLCQAVGGVAQDASRGGVVWHHECRQQLGHVRDAAPLVARKQPDGEVKLLHQVAACRQPQGDFAAFGLVEALKVGGVQIDLPITEWKHVARREPVDRPRLGSEELRRGCQLDAAVVELPAIGVLDPD
jgi:hypothetical protein